MAKTESYEEFVDKFKPKKTTDDCYTPQNIYEVIADFVSSEYGVERSDMVRPFWPGGDYQAFDYPAGCCVVDNPPFSILAKICTFYAENNIKFFLFAPALLLFKKWAVSTKTTCLCVGVTITYENGANVATSFVTNLDSVAARSYPELYKIVDAENKKNLAEIRKQTPKYVYPDELLTCAMGCKYSKYGVDFSVGWDDISQTNALDAQKPLKKSVFGGGYLLSERAAAERAAAERAAAERAAATAWKLSDREKGIVKKLGNQGGDFGAPTG